MYIDVTKTDQRNYRNIQLEICITVLYWLLIVGLTFYFSVAHIVGYSIKGIPYYFGASLMNTKTWFYLHMASGATAILLSLLQFWKTFRKKYIRSIVRLEKFISLVLLFRLFVWFVFFLKVDVLLVNLHK